MDELTRLAVENTGRRMRAEYAAGTLVWTAKDGRAIPVKDMDIPHITSTINILRRNGSVIAGTWVSILESELESRNQ